MFIVVPRLGPDVGWQAIARRIESWRWVGTLTIRMTGTIYNFQDWQAIDMVARG